MGQMVDNLDKDVTSKYFLGVKVNNMCCGLVYQMCGAFDCCLYTCGRMCRVEEDPERERTLAYYLDIWALVLLGVCSFGVAVGLIVDKFG